jgi:hypothetical protein
MVLGGGKGYASQGAGVEPEPTWGGCRGLPATVAGRRTDGWSGATVPGRRGRADACTGGDKGSAVAHGGPLWRRGSKRITISRPWPPWGQG